MFLHAEFDYGPQALGTFIGNLTFPMLGACNIDTSGEPALRDKLKQYIVLQYRQFKVRAVQDTAPHMHSGCHSCSTTPTHGYSRKMVPFAADVPLPCALLLLVRAWMLAAARPADWRGWLDHANDRRDFT